MNSILERVGSKVEIFPVRRVEFGDSEYPVGNTVPCNVRRAFLAFTMVGSRSRVITTSDMTTFRQDHLQPLQLD